MAGRCGAATPHKSLFIVRTPRGISAVGCKGRAKRKVAACNRRLKHGRKHGVCTYWEIHKRPFG